MSEKKRVMYIPIVLLGALRSGTTVFRLMLRHHPALASPGEADFLLDHIFRDGSHHTGWRYDRSALLDDRIFRAKEIEVQDDLDGCDLLHAMIESLAAKDPQCRLVLVFHRNAPKVAELLPSFPVLHLLRDPRDVARSSIGMGWVGNSYYGVKHWIDTEKGWDDANIPVDRVLTIKFEELMGDISSTLERVCAFLGLTFDPQMLTYHEDTTYDSPDPKIAQQWRRKALAREVALIEGLAMPLLTERGYTPAGAPRYPGMLEGIWLGLQNRLIRWRYNIRRFGLWLFFAHHAAQALGMKSLAHRLRKSQEEILTKTLK